MVASLVADGIPHEQSAACQCGRAADFMTVFLEIRKSTIPDVFVKNMTAEIEGPKDGQC